MGAMLIRKLVPEDAEQIRPLRLRGLAEHPEAFGSSVEEEKERPVKFFIERMKSEEAIGNFMFGAFDEDDQLIGMVGFHRQDHIKQQHKGFIWGMYVPKEHQGKGIGRRLLETTINEVKGRPHLEELILQVASVNEGARKIYESLGFEKYAVEPRSLKVNGKYYDEDYMLLKLK